MFRNEYMQLEGMYESAESFMVSFFLLWMCHEQEIQKIVLPKCKVDGLAMTDS